jgi:hypothetical protein
MLILLEAGYLSYEPKAASLPRCCFSCRLLRGFATGLTRCCELAVAGLPRHSMFDFFWLRACLPAKAGYFSYKPKAASLPRCCSSYGATY